MLGCVRRGAPTEEMLHTLEKCVIKVSVPEIFSELQKEGKIPVCLFPTRKQYDQLNEQMLARLDCPKKEIFCSDEVDETKSSNKWHKKAAEQLDKLNNDCNNIAGLQAVVKVAVGARVM